MDANDGFDGKPTNLNCFYMPTNLEQKYLKPAKVGQWASEICNKFQRIEPASEIF